MKMSALSVLSSQLMTVTLKLPIIIPTLRITDTATVSEAMATPVRLSERTTFLGAI